MARDFAAKVPDEEYDRFQRVTGGKHGATTWFIVSALKAFNDKAELVPSPPEQLVKAIDKVVNSFYEARAQD